MMKRRALVLLLLTTGLPLALGSQQRSLGEVYNHARKSVVLLVTFDAQGEPQSLGSGVILTSDGEIVTTLHVVRGAKALTAKLWNGTYLHLSEAVGVDTKADLLILKADARDLQAARTGATSSVAVGDSVMAIGNPLGLESALSTGVVSGFRQLPERGRVIQTTAPISPGSSGGGLFDVEGGLIGITCSTLVEGQNLNFAIPIEAAAAVPRMAARRLDRLPGIDSALSATSSSSEASAHLVRAKKYLSLEMLDDAEKELLAALSADKFDPEVHFQLGGLFGKRKNAEKAREEFKIAANLDPHSISPWMGVALSDIVLLGQEGHREARGEAIQCLRHVQQEKSVIKKDRYSNEEAVSGFVADAGRFIGQLLNITGDWLVPNSSGIWRFRESDSPKGKTVQPKTGLLMGNIGVLQAYGPQPPTIGFMWRNSELELEGWYAQSLPEISCNASVKLLLQESDDGMRLSGSLTPIPPEKPRKGCSYSWSLPVELIRN